jgi:hypothetical protein
MKTKADYEKEIKDIEDEATQVKQEFDAKMKVLKEKAQALVKEIQEQIIV